MASSSNGTNEAPSTRDDGSESKQGELRLRKSRRQRPLRAMQLNLKLEICLDEDDKEFVEVSGDAPLLWQQLIEGRHMSLSSLRQALGYSDSDFDEHTAAFQARLRANLPYDPTLFANISRPRARLQSHITPGEPQCYHVIPHLRSLATSLDGPFNCSIDDIFESDFDNGFTIYQVASTGKFSLLHAMIAALTMRHPSLELSVLDLYYFYKKAAPSKRFSLAAGGWVHFDVAAPNFKFGWATATEAMNDYLHELGPGHHVLVVVRPGETSVSDMFTYYPIRSMYWALRTAEERVWLMCATNKSTNRSHYNVVMRHEAELSPSLVAAANKLESQQTLEYNNRIQSLETDLKDRGVSMSSLTLQETRELFHETAAARLEHLNRPEFVSNTALPAIEDLCLEIEHTP